MSPEVVRRSVTLIMAVALSPMSSLAAQQTPSTTAVNSVVKPPAAEIEQWIRELDAPEFAQREAATRQLIDAGSVAREALIQAAQSGSLETTARAITILRKWYTSGQDDLVEAAETAFEQLLESKNRNVASRSAAVLEQYASTIRQERALARIEQLGGTIEKSTLVGRFRGGGGEESHSVLVILGRNWRGGEEGLKYLRRVTSLRGLYYLQDQITGKIVTPGVTQDGLDELRRSIPGLSIDPRGPAFLGVKTQVNVPICRVDEVAPDTPAAKAKLLAGDVIIRFDDQPISNFQDLIKNIGTKDPGVVVKLEILRGCDDNDLLLLERLNGLPDRDVANEHLQKLRDRFGQKIHVTLGEWGKK
jgi:hypothetical protein